MESLFPTTMITLLEYFAPLFAANNFLYFRGVVLAAMLLGISRQTLHRRLQSK